jgi:hypothetical protein
MAVLARTADRNEARTQPGWDRTPVFTGSSKTKPFEAMLRNGAELSAGQAAAYRTKTFSR